MIRKVKMVQLLQSKCNDLFWFLSITDVLCDHGKSHRTVHTTSGNWKRWENIAPCAS